MLAKLLSGAGSARPLPLFVSSSVVRVSAATATVTAPSGIQNGDLLIAVAYHAATSNIPTPPTGFTQIFNDAGGNGSWSIGTKVANNESGNYTFSWATSGTATCSILVYRNATTVNTLGTLTSAANGTTVSASSITPTYRGTLCVAYAVETNITITTPPSGLTERVSNLSTAPAVAVYDLSNQADAATSSYSLTWTGSAVSSAIQFQITNEPLTVAPEFVASSSNQLTSGSASLPINKPTGTVENDLMIAIMYAPGGGTTWTGDTGWTEVVDIAASTNLRIAYKVAGASEGSSYTFTCAATRTGTGTILTYRYASYDAIGTAVTGSSTASSVTTSASQSVLIAALSNASSSVTISAPAGMTSRAIDNDGTTPSYGIFDQVVPKGPSGARTTSSSLGASVLLSIKPTRSL